MRSTGFILGIVAAGLILVLAVSYFTNDSRPPDDVRKSLEHLDPDSDPASETNSPHIP